MINSSDEIGFLIVNVKTANGALPVEGASVTIYANEIKNDELLLDSDVIYNLKTDKNGKTPKVALKTKNKDLSLSYENSFPYLISKSDSISERSWTPFAGSSRFSQPLRPVISRSASNTRASVQP